jgi:3-phenylpropionate/trans-cinnamate dioxygenase ferredoxin reductase component
VGSSRAGTETQYVSMTARQIVVIGAGPAGVFAAIEAKRRDPGAEVTLVSDERSEPYERPPLSKAVLLGKARAADAPIAGPKGVAGHGVSLMLHTRCTAIDRAARMVVTAAGRRLPYDALVVATGSVVRQIPALPLGAPRVHYLRTDAHADTLAAELKAARHLAVVGGGLIGLEVAASACELGIGVTVIEVAPRILARVCDEETSGLIEAEHRRHGVDIRLNAALIDAGTGSDGRLTLETSAGEIVPADLVVVGAGAMPDDRLAAAAGLTTDNGILIDEHCRSSDPAIFAAGDAARFPGPHGLVRQEDWRHAQDQGSVAGRNAAGASDAYRSTPSFWSEQFGLYIQGVGWPSPRPDRRVRRRAANLVTFELTGRHIGYALGINAQRDMAVVRRLIERRIAVDPAALADPTIALADLLKAKP